MLFCVFFALCVVQVAAFRPTRLGRVALPRLASAADEGYGPFGSLTRQGPVPFFIRLAKPDTYEQAVQKYMLGEKVRQRTLSARLLTL